MKSVIVDIRDSFAAVLSDDGRICKIPNKNYAIGQVIELKSQAVKKTGFIAAWAAAAAVLVCAVGVGVWAYTSPFSYVSLDVNPSIEYTLNRFDRVLSVSAVNDDGKEILDELDLQSLHSNTIEEAVGRTVQVISGKGYFDQKLGGGGAVLITTAGEDANKSEKLAQQLKNQIEEETQEQPVEVSAQAVGYDRVERARELGVTPGKLNLVEKLLAGSPNPESVDINQWLDKPVRDIMKAIKDDKKTAKDSTDSSTSEGPAPSSAPDSDSAVSSASTPEEKAQAKTEEKQSKAEEKQEKTEAKAEEKQDKAEEKQEKAEAKAEEKQDKAEEKQEKAEAKADKGGQGNGKKDK